MKEPVKPGSKPIKKLTPVQYRVLLDLKRRTDHSLGMTRQVDLRCNKGVLERLRDAGLLHSAGPFAWQFHNLTITDAGRAALLEKED
jgi:hypothetical protein